MAEALLECGNDYGRETYLQHFPKGAAKPNEHTDERALAAHLRNKYVRLRWADPKLWAERQAVERARTDGAARAARRGPMASLSRDAFAK